MPLPKSIVVIGLILLFGQTACTPPKADEPRIVTMDPAGVVTVDRQAGVIDLQARMVTREPEWLELVATTPPPGGRDHEAIVTVDAQPRLIHLALVMLGLEPGHPLINEIQGEQIVSTPPAGPEVALFFVYEQDGVLHETPVHEWVVHLGTSEPLPACRWLFTGSRFRQWQGKDYYMADEAGNIASLVNFGDDLIVRKTDMAQDTDFQQLQLNKDKALPYGTELVLRIRKVESGD